MPMRQVYKNIDFSIIVLLAAMIPVGGALQSSGATELISQTVLAIAGKHSAMLIIGILLFVTMTLSDVMNNAATAVVMSPIAVSMAQSMHLNVDPFLMAVSVGASCSFLTPISHQNNTLVMGPGGYKFYDYLRLGIPVEIIVLILAIPAISWFWL
jgi:di/tricarboxylate transporter